MAAGPLQPSVLLVGNFLSSSVGNRSVCEELSVRLRQHGWSVLTTSSKPGRTARVLDMVRTCWSRRKDYGLANVDVYSGAAFAWAEMVCEVLRRLRKTYVLSLHGGNLPEFAMRWPSRVRRLLDGAAEVTAPSDYLRSRLALYRPDMLLIPNALDVGGCPFRLRDNPRPRLVWLRAFHHIYNPSMAVRVLARLTENYPSAHLLMVGPDKGDGSLQLTRDQAERLKVADRVEIHGAVPKAEVPSWIQKGDIFLNTSNFDNTPVSVIEAMACGACVVSTDAGGMPYLLSDWRDALLVPRDDCWSMANAAAKILSEPGLAPALSTAARKKAERFDWVEVMEQWQALLGRLAA